MKTLSVTALMGVITLASLPAFAQGTPPSPKAPVDPAPAPEKAPSAPAPGSPKAAPGPTAATGDASAKPGATPSADTPPADTPPATPPSEGSPPSETAPPSETVPDGAPTPDGAPGEAPADGIAPTETDEDSGSLDPASTEAVEGPAPGKHSASANQGTEIPPDDYEGATDDALTPEEKGPKNLSLGVALDLTWPMGAAADFVNNASIQGLSLDLRYYAFGNFGIGAGVGLNSLSKKLNGTLEWENSMVTGVQVREISYTPLTLKGYYAFRDNERFVPYFALGAGVARTARRAVVGFSSVSDASWHFALIPEAGLQIPAGPTVVLTNIRFNYLPPSAGIDTQLFANLSFGLAIQ